MWVDEPQLSARVTRKASCLFLGRNMSVVSFIMGEGYLLRKMSVVSCIGGSGTCLGDVGGILHWGEGCLPRRCQWHPALGAVPA